MGSTSQKRLGEPAAVLLEHRFTLNAHSSRDAFHRVPLFTRLGTRSRWNRDSIPRVPTHS
jgi:hypothetical protein